MIESCLNMVRSSKYVEDMILNDEMGYSLELKPFNPFIPFSLTSFILTSFLRLARSNSFAFHIYYT